MYEPHIRVSQYARQNWQLWEVGGSTVVRETPTRSSQKGEEPAGSRAKQNPRAPVINCYLQTVSSNTSRTYIPLSSYRTCTKTDHGQGRETPSPGLLSSLLSDLSEIKLKSVNKEITEKLPNSCRSYNTSLNTTMVKEEVSRENIFLTKWKYNLFANDAANKELTSKMYI